MTDQNHSEDRVTVWMSSDLTSELDSRLSYSDSRSEWVREAVQLRMVLEDALNRRNIDIPADADDRQAFFEDIAHAGVATFDGSD
ncbi:MAG: hypothetical protein ACOCR6_01850 [archaeon]